MDRLRNELGADGFAEVAAGSGGQRRRRLPTGSALDDDGRAIALSEADAADPLGRTAAFDSPLDRAVEINLMGPVRIAETLARLGAPPHLVAVSTCYVAGNCCGAAPEEPVTANPFFADLDWRAEVDAARRTRADVDDESRTPNASTSSACLAGARPGWRPLIAERTESPRKDWVHDRMVTFEPVPGHLGRLARRLRALTRRSARSPSLARSTVPLRGRPGHRLHDRAPVDHRVRVGRAPPRLDPRLPHGRADHP